MHESSCPDLTRPAQGAKIMDARRTEARTRNAWYAYYRWLGFASVDSDLLRAYRGVGISE